MKVCKEFIVVKEENNFICGLIFLSEIKPNYFNVNYILETLY